MAPAANWLSFSLSTMEMLRSSESQFISYEGSSTPSPHYLIDNFSANGWGSSKEAQGMTTMADTSILTSVTRHRWIGRYEAHLWDNNCRREGQARKGRQGPPSLSLSLSHSLSLSLSHSLSF